MQSDEGYRMKKAADMLQANLEATLASIYAELAQEQCPLLGTEPIAGTAVCGLQDSISI
jgi:hypothetical protein